MGKPEDRIKELGLTFPERPVAIAAYATSVALPNQLMFVSGQTAKDENGPIICGKVGGEVSAEQAYEAAKICALRLICEVKHALGSLDRVERIVKVNGYVNSTPDFTMQPKVINGASEFLEEVFGEKGKHSRTAVGVSALPENASVEVDMILMYR